MMVRRMRQHLSRCASRLGNREQLDRGDTLIEILMTVAVISIAMVALIGGLLTTVSASTTHRNFATADTALRSFAETAKYAIETAPSNGASSGPQFAQCVGSASNYKVVGDPYPRSGPAGTTVTVFGLGYAGNGGANIGGVTANNIRLLPGTLGAPSGEISVFTVPAGLAAGSYTVYPFGGSTDASPVQFTVTSSASGASPFASYYTLSASLQYWNGAGWSVGCTPGSSSNLQQLTFTLNDSQPNNGGQDQASVVLGNYKTLGTPTVSTSLPMGESSTQSLGSPLTFNATVTAAAGYATPTGTISWSFPAGTPAGSQNCPNFTLPGTATCTVTGSNAGTFTPTAIYSGDLVNGPAEGNQASITVNPAAPPFFTVSVNPTSSASGPTVGATLTYKATITPQGGITPTGTITWTPPPGSSCVEPITQNVPASPGPYSVTCTVTSALVGTQTAQAAFTSGDANYPNQGPASASVIVLNATSVTVTASSVLSGSKTNITFTATVNSPNALPHGDQVSWSGMPAGTNCPTALPNSAPYTLSCTINNAAATTYSPVVNFLGDSTHATSSGTTSYTMPTVTWSSSLTIQGHGVNAVNVLTITATISGGSTTPSGNVSMSASGSPGIPTCSASLNSSGQAQCQIAGVTSSGTYTATITWPGNSSYATVTSTSPGYNG